MRVTKCWWAALLTAMTGLGSGQTAWACHGCGYGGPDCVMAAGWCGGGGHSSAGGCCGAATVLVPQQQTYYQTVCETVYDQVPVTQMQTRFRTDYRSEQVPVTEMVTEQVPVTQMQTRYRTDYRSEQVPVTQMVTEQVP